MQFTHFKHTLKFKVPGGTSRGILKTKDSHVLVARKDNQILGIGECSFIPGLSPDPVSLVDERIQQGMEVLMGGEPDTEFLDEYFSGIPAVRFGFETLLMGLKGGNPMKLIHTPFVLDQKGISINGLVWMGTLDSMLRQVEQKIEEGYKCIKLKIGAINFRDECRLLRHIRESFSREEIEIRVDANGAFKPDEALEKLHVLADFHLHSIEQPIGTNQWSEMAALCRESPVSIALDEELIGLDVQADRKKMLETIRPEYIILKPSLLGGIASSAEWIRLADELGISYWVTSALESNIGLNAIAQWTAKLDLPIPQGLGTGSLFTNNFDSPLLIREGHLYYEPGRPWNFDRLGNGKLYV